tara:strand:- start:6758 stop:7087 length:330 start_codon:yes stop_codon:yes gene_type:complete
MDLFPKKSLLGRPLLNSKLSTISAYFLLIILFISKPLFGNEPMQIMAGFGFIVLLNLSCIILIINSIKQRKKKKSFDWVIVNLPLWISIPLQVRYLIYGITGLLTSISN